MRTEVTLKHKDKTFTFIYDWESDYRVEAADFMFEEGNYSCDCNKSLFIQEHCDKSFPKMTCGQQIKLIELRHNA